MKLLLITLFISIGTLKAQDFIHKLDKEVMSCEIISVDVDNVKYIQRALSGTQIQSISRAKVWKLVYASGITNILNDNGELESVLSAQAKNVFKFGAFSPLSGAFAVGYERSLRPTRSFELSVGIIGLGVTIYEEAKGLYFKGGYKLIKSPDYYYKAGDNTHILAGAFIRPDISIAYFAYDMDVGKGRIIRENALSASIILNFGKQWILDDEFSLSINIGAGYAISSGEEYYYSHFTMGNEFPLALTIGMTIGLVR